MQDFFKALRARKIDRVAAVYAVAAWILAQAASIALPAFDAPQWALRAFIVLEIVGFPVTLAIAWVAAPHPRPKKGRLPPSSRRTDITLISALALVLTAIVVQSAIVFLRPAGPKQGASAAAAGMFRAGDVTSIAVLPFTSLSADPSNRYFSDGISTELIAQLSQVPDLRVAARASSFSFQSRSADIKTIAKALNVRAILDGAVRVDGARVRIEAELSSDDGFTIWSHGYAGDLTHILDLQDEIARAITAALTHRLLGKNDSARVRPASVNPEAYRLYLEGRYYYAERSDADVAKAIALFQQATVLQPDFADGFAALARAESSSAFNFGNRQFIAPGEAAVRQALHLDPANVEALYAQAALSLVNWDWDGAAAVLRRLRALKTSSSETLNSEAVLFKYLGFPERSLSAARAATQLDPLFPVAWANIASSLFELGRYQEAGIAAGNGLALLPHQPDILVEQCGAFAHTGRLKEAQAIAGALLRAGDGKHADGCLFEIALVRGRSSEARRVADRIAQGSNVGAARLRETLGQYYLLSGDVETALVEFERAFAARELGLFTVREDHSTPASLADDPAWKALWRNAPMVKWQVVHDQIAGEIGAK